MKHALTAKRLTEALDRKGMKAKELMDKSDVSKASISQYINGAHAPSNISAGKMAKVLGVSPVWLMGFDVPMYDTENDSSQKYYENEELAKEAQEMFEDKQMRSLFHMKKNMDPKRFQAHVDMMKEMYRLEHPEDFPEDWTD